MRWANRLTVLKSTLGVFTEKAFGLQVTCDEAGGDFQFSGCTENVCSAGSGDRTGYKVCQYDATYIDEPVAEAMGVAGTCEALLNDPCGALRPASLIILRHLDLLSDITYGNDL